MPQPDDNTSREPKKHAYLGLGSSLGDRAAHLRTALHQLREADGTRIIAVSPVYESPHLGLEPGDAQRYPSHLNCVACVETTKTPLELLALIGEIETRGQRQRTQRWGPRTIDIDLLLYEDIVLHTDILTIPHPGLASRAFVLQPLHDLMPDLVLPNGQSVRELLETDVVRAQKSERVESDELLI